MILQHDPRPGRVMPDDYCLRDGDRIVPVHSKASSIDRFRQKTRLKRWQQRLSEHRDGRQPRLELFKT